MRTFRISGFFISAVAILCSGGNRAFVGSKHLSNSEKKESGTSGSSTVDWHIFDIPLKESACSRFVFKALQPKQEYFLPSQRPSWECGCEKFETDDPIACPYWGKIEDPYLDYGYATDTIESKCTTTTKLWLRKSEMLSFAGPQSVHLECYVKDKEVATTEVTFKKADNKGRCFEDNDCLRSDQICQPKNGGGRCLCPEGRFLFFKEGNYTCKDDKGFVLSGCRDSGECERKDKNSFCDTSGDSEVCKCHRGFKEKDSRCVPNSAPPAGYGTGIEIWISMFVALCFLF